MFFTHTVLRLYKKYRKKNTDRQKLKFFPENCQFFAERLTGCAVDRTLHEKLIRCAGIGQRDAARSGTERDWHAVWGIRPFGQKKNRSAHFDRNGSLFLKLKDLLEFGVHVLVATATAAISADDDTAGVNQDLGR